MSQLEFFDVPSPCIGICMSDEKGYCKGCFRTREERRSWISLSSDLRQAIIKRCVQRKKRSGNKRHFKDRLFDNFSFEGQDNIEISSRIKDMFGSRREAVRTSIRDISSIPLTKEDSQEIIRVAKESNVDMSAEVESAVTAALIDKDLSKLSRKSLKTLYFIFCNILIPIILAIWVVPALQEHLQSAKSSLADVKSKSEIKQKLKSLNTYLLSGHYRVITGSSLHLRLEPNKNSEVIGYLELGEVVEVIESSNRSWLKVKLTGNNGEIEGWVFRRYTLQIK